MRAVRAGSKNERKNLEHMPTIRNGQQIVEADDLCARCTTGAAANCVFLDAMKLMEIDVEGSGRVQSCALFSWIARKPVDPEEMFDEDDEL